MMPKSVKVLILGICAYQFAINGQIFDDRITVVWAYKTNKQSSY